MKYTQHTPGPWSEYGCVIMSGLPNAGGRAEYGSRYIGNTAPECPDDMPNREDLANARLIAAAPDMLDALEKIESDLTALLCERVLDSTLPEFYTVRDARNAAREAIAKATGQA